MTTRSSALAPATVTPGLAIPPGETLLEELAARGISQAELARRAGRPVQAINEIARGKKGITAETALVFERVLGVSAEFWMRLEADYRLARARRRIQLAKITLPRSSTTKTLSTSSLCGTASILLERRASRKRPRSRRTARR